MAFKVAHISDIHVARQPEKSAEADVNYLRSYLKRVMPIAGDLGGVLTRYAGQKIEEKDFQKNYIKVLEQIRDVGGRIDAKTVIGLSVGLFGASMGLAFIYRRELMKLLSALQYRERKEMREVLLAGLEQERPNVVLVTGDLTTVASETEFHEAKVFLDGIKNLKCKPVVLVIPGNHDVEDARKGEKHARLDTYAKVFSDYLPKSVVPLKADFGEVVIFGVNSNTVGRGLGTDGRVVSRSMEFLKREFATVKGRAKLLAIHHHLAKYGREPRVPPLENARELLEIAEEGGVRLICHGHKHEFYEWRYSGNGKPAEDSEDAITVVCAGTSTEATTWKPKKLQFRVFEFDNGALPDPSGKTVTLNLPKK